jgi:peptidyl-prolyl cis-trans isomerase D
LQRSAPHLYHSAAATSCRSIMLQAIRSKASSLVVKILFGLLVISFGIWGIGDIFRTRGVDNTVATVGDRKIDAAEVNQAMRDAVEQLRAMFRGAPIDIEQLKQHGFGDEVLQRLVNRDLVDLEISRLRLAVDQDTVFKAIRADPAYHNGEGAFDPQVFKYQLDRQHKTEAQLQATVNADLTRSQLISAIVSGVAAPAALVDTLSKLRNERRVAEIATLPASAAGTPGAPSDADLAQTYEQHKGAFRVPELRSFTVGVLSLDDIAAHNEPTDEQLHAAYQERSADFTTPEQRHLQQMLLPNEAKAKEAADALAGGKDFVTVATEVAGMPAANVDLGSFTRDDLPAKLAEPVFALKLNETTAPIEDEVGWHILRVSEIKPEATKPFDEVKDTLAKDLAKDAAGNEIAKTANQIDDKMAGGAAFGDVVQGFGLKTTRLENVDANGHDAAGKTIDLPQPREDILRAAFSTDSGQTSPLTEMGENGYFLVQVDKVTPETFKPADEVHDQLVAFWQADWRDKTLEKQAGEIAEQVNAGGALDKIASERKLKTATSQPLQRSGGDTTVPPAAVAKIFEAKPGTAVVARSADGYVVAVVKEVLPPDPAQEGAAATRLSQQLTPELQEDLFQEFDKALRDRYPVTVNSANLARAF